MKPPITTTDSVRELPNGRWVVRHGQDAAEVRDLQERLHALGWGVGDLAGVPSWPEDARAVVEGLIEALVLAERGGVACAQTCEESRNTPPCEDPGTPLGNEAPKKGLEIPGISPAERKEG